MAAPEIPVRYRVADRRTETADTVTLRLVPIDSPVHPPLPGQFMMLTVFGVGEVPISISAPATGDGHELVHTIRNVGPVTAALHAVHTDAVVGVRGPFGNDWRVDDSVERDLVFVAGGIGLAPLRPAIQAALGTPKRDGRVVVLVGARTPDDLLFRDDLAQWTNRSDVALAVTVDQAWHGWRGNVGLVTSLLRRAVFDASWATAFICGPEMMMRVVAAELLERGMDARDVRLSMERNMPCGNGLCGHCQLGPLLLCRDGPVVGLDRVAVLMATREL